MSIIFNFFKKQKFIVVSPAEGKIKSITEVKDEVFSSKSLGDGFAIEPVNGEVYSPIEGTIEMVFPTLHALGIKSSNGVEVLIHIGIDSVNLNGEGFMTLVKEGKKVKTGDKIVEFDIESIENKIPSTDVIVVFTSGEACDVIKNGQHVSFGEEDIVNLKIKNDN